MKIAKQGQWSFNMFHIWDRSKKKMINNENRLKVLKCTLLKAYTEKTNPKMLYYGDIVTFSVREQKTIYLHERRGYGVLVRSEDGNMGLYCLKISKVGVRGKSTHKFKVGDVIDLIEEGCLIWRFHTVLGNVMENMPIVNRLEKESGLDKNRVFYL